ncbi:hypothetical protein GOP47_0010780 [Adiantum capillus-veneris]|uniref:Cyclin-like domain-containing protein n=1 Tax=Adiantum capillus-veneris TaxID=13818 RepID=A0A9D4UVX1_ADICA|nr:hypothetical protein GOP47_0010780 [Adiantum capillus-veneris]
MLDFGPGSFFLGPAELVDSPSFRHGVSADTEKSLRIYACEIIQEAGILLRLPQAVAATAQVLFHRFFCKQSFRDFDARSAAASCFWLSMKLEEVEGASNRGHKPSQLNDVVHMFEHIRARREGTHPLPPHAPGFKIRKEQLLKLETRILVELGFVCHVEHPHKLMLGYLNCLQASKDLIQESWNLVNDSLRTTLCVSYPSNVIACGIIYAAARLLSVALPENPPWWALFDVTSDQIRSICAVLADLYRQPKAQFIDVKAPSLKSVAAISSLPVSSSLDSLIKPAQVQPSSVDSASNCANSADICCSNSNHVISPSSTSKVLNSCVLNASGFPPSKDVARDDASRHLSRVRSSEGKKRSRESPGRVFTEMHTGSLSTSTGGGKITVGVQVSFKQDPHCSGLNGFKVLCLQGCGRFVLRHYPQ